MLDRSTCRLIGTAAAFVLSAASFACVDIVSAARYVEREDKKFAVSGKPDVSLSTFDGSIEIRPSGRGEVAVTIEKHAMTKEAAAQIEVHTEQNANHIVVDVRIPKRNGFLDFNNNLSAKLIVSLPAESDVRAHSGDGSIDIERIAGTFELRSGDGSIRARDLTGDVKVHTGDGAIRIDSANGAVDADTGDGSVTLSGKFTELRVRTGDGSVNVRAESGSAASADWNVTTGDGSIVLELPDNFNGELDAHTGDGAIQVQDVTVSNVTGRITKHDLRGRLGTGGAAVRLRTGDGTITLRRS